MQFWPFSLLNRLKMCALLRGITWATGRYENRLQPVFSFSKRVQPQPKNRSKSVEFGPVLVFLSVAWTGPAHTNYLLRDRATTVNFNLRLKSDHRNSATAKQLNEEMAGQNMLHACTKTHSGNETIQQIWLAQVRTWISRQLNCFTRRNLQAKLLTNSVELTLQRFQRKFHYNRCKGLSELKSN